MILIVDSGSTKADWSIIKENFEIISLQTVGCNPLSKTTNEINLIIQEKFNDQELNNTIKEIYFYGAGCWDASSSSIVKKALQTTFNQAFIQVESDLMGAVHATCQNQAGITAILGTGSNSCLYDGSIIIDQIPSLGYIIGDEGSGNHLGKTLIQHYFYRELPTDLQQAFELTYQLDKAKLIENVYYKDNVSSYLANFAPFIIRYQQHPFIETLVKECFMLFFKKHIFKYEDYKKLPIHFIGSIAVHLKTILKAILKEQHLQMGVLLKRPIDALTTYHLTKFKLS